MGDVEATRVGQGWRARARARLVVVDQGWIHWVEQGVPGAEPGTMLATHEVRRCDAAMVSETREFVGEVT